jgi:hypothetical protein
MGAAVRLVTGPLNAEGGSAPSTTPFPSGCQPDRFADAALDESWYSDDDSNWDSRSGSRQCHFADEILNCVFAQLGCQVRNPDC